MPCNNNEPNPELVAILKQIQVTKRYDGMPPLPRKDDFVIPDWLRKDAPASSPSGGDPDE